MLASYQRNTSPFPVTALLYIPMPVPMGITGMLLLMICGISLIPMLPGAGTATWKNITSAILCSSFPAITMNSGQISLYSCVLPAQDGMIRSVFLLLSMNWKNICQQFPLRTCAWIPQWTITPPTGFLKTVRYGHLSTLTTNAADQKQFRIPLPLTKMVHLYARKTSA